MAKFRTKIKGQAKGKRWAKGQSSSSNPQTKTHRAQAKSRFFQANLGTSNLTTTALQKHDAEQTYSTTKVPQMDVETMESESCYSASQSYQTMRTFASDWTDCTNMSFNRFLNVFRSDSALHKEMLAILAAITEVIKANDGTESPTEYYCALVTTLEQILEADEKNEDQITAVLSLMSMGIKTVPTPVLRQSYDSVTGKMLEILVEFTAKDNNVVVKSIMGILGVLLKQQELVAWQNMHTQQIFHAILNPFCIHTKPKWRKAAQHTVASILTAEIFQNDQNYTPAAELVAKFCKDTLEACLGSNSNSTVLVSSVQAGQTTILHTLGLLQDTIIHFNKSQVKHICETILRLMSLNYPIVTSCGLQVLHALFSAQKAVASVKLNSQIIAALYDYQPSAVDAQPTLGWLTVMKQAHVHLADVDLHQCATALPVVFNCITQLWLSQKREIVLGATHSLETLFRDAVAQICADSNVLAAASETKLAKCIQSVELGLGYQYNHAWPQVLHITAVMFEVCGTTCSKLLLNTLKTLSELRDSYKFSYNNELERAVGAAVKSMGPETVLSVISLRKDNGELNLDRSWLLPVLKENVQRSTLDFWVRGILPIAIFCQKRSVELGERNDGIGAHSAELLHLQLWNLLPSFCNQATDIHTGFKSIAKVLGMAISDRKELRLAVMASLRKLILAATTSEDEKDMHEIARFDKNFLPILFNVYTAKPVGSHEEGQRLAAMDTIKAFLPIARKEFNESLFTNALERLETLMSHPPEGDDLFYKESIMQLIKAMVPYQTSENIEKMFEMCIKNLPEIKNNKEQKKAYRLLEEICGCSSEGCQGFLKKHRKYVQKLLQKALTTSAVSSKGARLRCLNYLLKAQPQLDQDSILIKSTVPEAVLGCKDQNKRCRLISYEVLNTIGEILLSHDQMQAFVTLLISGLAGSPELMSATLLAIASVLHTFTASLGQNNIELILENVLHLMKVPTREVVGSCLSFLKVFMTSMPTPQVGAQLASIVKAFCSMNEDCQRHFRMKVRNMLSKLVRKFGCDAISPHIPQTDKVMYKRLRNLRKLLSRQKRQKEQASKDTDDDDMDVEDEFIVKARAKTVEDILADSDSDFDDQPEDKGQKKQRKYSAYIEEDEDEIVDFKDPSVASKITTSRPGQSTSGHMTVQKEVKKDRGFKTASDGRLIIADGSDSDSDGHGKSTKKNKFAASDSDSDDDNLSKAETEIMRDRKRKRTDASSVASSFQSKYKPGGSGIHRPTGPSEAGRSRAGSVKSFASFGSDYKSKKADGDIKRKGKVDPYAYMPLQRSALNKRKRLKNTGQFKNIIGGAKAGSKKGMKARKRLGK